MKEDPLFQYVGLRLNRNVYNRFGVLIVPRLTILSRKEIELLIQQEIKLGEDDVEHVSVMCLVDAAVEEIKSAFEKVRKANRIPLERVRDKLIPIIHEMSRHPDLKSILNHLHQHDEYTYRHSIGVALISRIIGRARRMPPQELTELTVAGFLHDIGKVKIPNEILNKPGKLTQDEFNRIKSHTIYGFDIIRNSEGITHRQALVALQHHEREDGSGYPYGLMGQDIDLHSKIVAVADVFHAMISKRVYKDSVPFYKVLHEMSQYAYGTLEPTITLCFLRRIMDMLIGNRVALSNGCEGNIVMIRPDDPVRPLVEVNGEFIDLSKDQTIYLDRIV